MNLEEENKFNNFGWKSKILYSNEPEIVNIIIPDEKKSTNFQVLISKDIDGVLTTECKIYLNEKIYKIDKIDLDENSDYLVDLIQNIN